MNLPIRHHNKVPSRVHPAVTARSNGAANRHLHAPRSTQDIKRGHAKGIVMRNLFSLALACLLAISSFAIAEAQDDRPRKVKLPVHQRTTAYAVQTVSVRTGCFSPRLEGILAHIAAKTGTRPLVTSGHRPQAHRSGSMHRFCQAADIRVPGVPESKILAAAKTAPGIGGIGRYCNGIVHVDTGARRHWTHCGRSKGHFLSAKRRSGKRA
jgi:hypothetical protein